MSELQSVSKLVILLTLSYPQFRKRGKEMIDVICDYYSKDLAERPVRSQVEASPERSLGVMHGGCCGCTDLIWCADWVSATPTANRGPRDGSAAGGCAAGCPVAYHARWTTWLQPLMGMQNMLVHIFTTHACLQVAETWPFCS